MRPQTLYLDISWELQRSCRGPQHTHEDKTWEYNYRLDREIVSLGKWPYKALEELMNTVCGYEFISHKKTLSELEFKWVSLWTDI